MIILIKLAELFKATKQSDPTVPLFDGLFLESIKDADVNFVHNLY